MSSQDGLPEPAKATSWIEGNWYQIAPKLAGGGYALGGLALGLLIYALAQLPLAFLAGWVLAWLVVVGVWSVFAADARNAAAPGWLASRSRFRWTRVDLDQLSAARRLSRDSFRLTDSDGGRAVLAMEQENAAEVLNVIRRDLTRARKRGVRFPERLSALVDGRD